MAKIGEIQPKRGPTTTQVLAVVILFPLAASLLVLAGITLAGTLMSLAVATPLFLIFSPVLIPAAILIAGAVTGILTSGAFGLTGLSSVLWVSDSFRRATGQGPFEYAKRRALEVVFRMGKMVKMAGEKMKRDQKRQSMLGTKFVKVG